MLTVLRRQNHHQQTLVAAGAVLLAEGTKTGKLFVLAQGAVEVARGGVVLAHVKEPGSVFGDMSALLDLPHTATVRTTAPSAVYAFDDAGAFLRSDPEIAFVLARMLAQRLEATTAALVSSQAKAIGYADLVAPPDLMRLLGDPVV